MTITTEIIECIGKRSLLLDSNFLLNTLHSPDEYYPLYESLKSNNIKIVTSEAIKIEIFKGTSSKKEFNRKKDFVNSVVENVLPIHEKEIVSYSAWMTVAYGKAGSRVSVGDLLIAGTLKKYSNDLVMLSADVADFPRTLFNWEGVVNVEIETDSKKDKGNMLSKIDTYALISFSEEKYKKALENFNNSK